MGKYEYKVWKYKATDSFKFGNVAEVCRFTGLSLSRVLTSMKRNKPVDGYRIARIDVNENRRVIEEYIKDSKLRCSVSDGIIAFDSEGKRYRFSSIDEANKGTKIPKLHIRECLKEGCAYEGWTFDYALDKQEGSV